jgi:hypothetical protein
MLRARGRSFLSVVLAVVLGVVIAAVSMTLGSDRKLYETCNAFRHSPCEEGLVCVPDFQGMCRESAATSRRGCPGVCLVSCGEASQCPGKAACRQNLDGSIKFCAPAAGAFQSSGGSQR